MEEIWVPITLHLPIGFAKSWRPSAGCAPASFMCGPYAIILLAQLGNTVLVPVLPFLVREMGYSRSAYGALQSATWMSQTILSPLLGALSDRLGRRNVIFVSLLVSAAGASLSLRKPHPSPSPRTAVLHPLPSRVSAPPPRHRLPAARALKVVHSDDSRAHHHRCRLPDRPVPRVLCRHN